jgi:hypothetical protein
MVVATARTKETALAAAVNYLKVKPGAAAYIDENAKINVKTTLGGTAVVRANQEVLVTASSAVQTVNMAGNSSYFGLPFLPFLNWFGVKSGDTIGAGVQLIDYVIDARAEISKGVQLNSKTLLVTANSDSGAVSISDSGGSANQYGGIGVATVNRVNNHTTARIDDGATIVTLSGRNHAARLQRGCDWWNAERHDPRCGERRRADHQYCRRASCARAAWALAPRCR